MRKNIRLHTSDDEHCAVAMEKVLCDVHGKIKIKIPFFIRHFYSISNLGHIITQDCAKHVSGYYYVPQVALGYLKRTQLLFKVLNFDVY